MKYEEQLKKRNGLLHFYGAVYAGSVMFWGLFHFFIITTGGYFKNNVYFCTRKLLILI